MPTTPFLNMFARSPIRPIEEHMSKVNACVKELSVFFTAIFENKWDDAKTVYATIVRLEHDADHLKRDLRLHLPNSLFLPVSRSDLLELLNVQDQLANIAKEIATLVIGRKMQFPLTLEPLFIAFLHSALEATKGANLAIHELDELLETGFSGCEVDVVDKMITKLSQIEQETDHQHADLNKALFDLESTFPPVEIMFLYKLVDLVGHLADQARETGDRLQILVAR